MSHLILSSRHCTFTEVSGSFSTSLWCFYWFAMNTENSSIAQRSCADSVRRQHIKVKTHPPGVEISDEQRHSVSSALLISVFRQSFKQFADQFRCESPSLIEVNECVLMGFVDEKRKIESCQSRSLNCFFITETAGLQLYDNCLRKYHGFTELLLLSVRTTLKGVTTEGLFLVKPEVGSLQLRSHMRLFGPSLVALCGFDKKLYGNESQLLSCIFQLYKCVAHTRNKKKV